MQSTQENVVDKYEKCNPMMFKLTTIIKKHSAQYKILNVCQTRDHEKIIVHSHTILDIFQTHGHEKNPGVHNTRYLTFSKPTSFKKSIVHNARYLPFSNYCYVVSSRTYPFRTPYTNSK